MQDNFHSLICAALGHFPLTRVAPTSLSKASEKSSTGLCWSVYYSLSKGFEGWQFAWSQLFYFLCQNVYLLAWMVALRLSLEGVEIITLEKNPQNNSWLAFYVLFFNLYFPLHVSKREEFNNLKSSAPRDWENKNRHVQHTLLSITPDLLWIS